MVAWRYGGMGYGHINGDVWEGAELVQSSFITSVIGSQVVEHTFQ